MKYQNYSVIWYENKKHITQSQTGAAAPFPPFFFFTSFAGFFASAALAPPFPSGFREVEKTKSKLNFAFC